jgi:hypothetical protein
MNRLSLALLLCLAFVPVYGRGQDLASSIHTMTVAYAASGSIVVLDSNTIVIEPQMPAPLCAVPKDTGGRTAWSYYAFPLASITVPLAIVDDKLIGEDTAFTSPDAVKTYKPGQVGETTMIVITSVPGQQFHTLAYDRDKFLHLGPGPHTASEYGEAPDNTEAFGLTFSDRAAARAFANALRKAVLLARSKIARR